MKKVFSVFCDVPIVIGCILYLFAFLSGEYLNHEGLFQVLVLYMLLSIWLRGKEDIHLLISLKKKKADSEKSL